MGPLVRLTAMVALFVIGGVTYGIGGAPRSTKVIAADIQPIATQRLAALPLREETRSVVAADPVLERRLREFQEELARLWHAGLEGGAIGTETETETETDATGGTEIVKAAAMVVGPTTTATVAAPANVLTTVATTMATATAEPATGTTGSASASASASAAATAPAAANATAAASATATAAASASASADPRIATAIGTTTDAATAGVATDLAVATMISTADAGHNDVRVILYSASWCDVCARAKAWMVRHGIAFEERDVTTSDEYARELLLLSPSSPVLPTFDIEGRALVGFYPGRLLVMFRQALQRHAENPAF